ncbi:MAG: hypothetical protein A3F31_04820 [Candidatus Levybacteria bacterium RIFCSPHIGHO2_12_FULL_38_12]|nr:MAG: hypothetical protein A2770_04505 [Candidatus Levybacteria bacterium RIFCSPHIGHO2_01_FULL_38_12]OGH21853.1 MAG: hypothetical protein A3D75_01085 [Candidatus Levybacteria bacterium RIFCSPHIGHO2_02_FULL_37_18]OGH22647.1 MAG: hypothetical protein A3F31_04820 [Candidatus Levybacteria bacterium RIFCSPHIGHO2_12_FULL_38_12]OGH33473.1 MAG: hypothetical protein A3A47_04035 [Candidatus Levybacteria bacterium RIFCSPLOWO2_01_FULL_37_20]OGH44139.1 MAG: hypothetical protein A3J14_05190 [Candidatus Lev
MFFLNSFVGNIPSHFIRRFFYRLSGVKIGKGTTIHMGVRFYNSHNIVIGNDTIVGEGTALDGRDRLSIGSHVAIATEAMIYNSEHDIQNPNFTPIHAPVVVEDYVFIGPRSIILPGVTLGRGCIVAAGAIVTKNVESMDIVGGVPAKVIEKRTVSDLSYTLGRAAWFR